MISHIIDKLDDLVWGLPLITAILFTGVWLTILLSGRHLREIGKAFCLLFHKGEEESGEVSNFASLCMALSATIGTGNIVGVATAIALGGPGALFWMVVAAFFGMATKYAEGLLAVKYRTVTPEGKVLGGPFYYIEKGLGVKWKPLAVAFAIFGVGAGILGIGTITQINGITGAVETFFQPGYVGGYSASVIISGLFVTIAAALVIIGGVKRIAKVSTIIVPFMAISYIVFSLIVLIVHVKEIPSAVWLIIEAAFKPSAVTGGAVGTMFVAMQRGIARGIFSNEAGLGSAPIAAAAAKTKNPSDQGLICMIGAFIDTIIVCSMTGLVIVVTGAWKPIPGVEGAGVTIEAFTRGLGFLGSQAAAVSSFTLMLALFFFAFTTIIGWTYYSEKCLEYLVGSDNRKAIFIFRIAYIAMVAVGPYLTVREVWAISDIMNGLMALPNIIALIILGPIVAKESRNKCLRGEAEK